MTTTWVAIGVVSSIYIALYLTRKARAKFWRRHMRQQLRLIRGGKS